MTAATQHVLNRWIELRALLRRLPIIDWVVGLVIFGWGLSGALKPEAVVFHSHFMALQSTVTIYSALAIPIGLAHLCAFFINKKLRIGVSFCGLWILLALWMSVGSITGRVAWGGYFLLEMLITLSVID